MRVSDKLVESRRKELAKLICQNKYMPIKEICALFSVSEATARRDLKALQDDSEIVRTFGGAVGDFDAGFASFAERRNVDAEAKGKMAKRGLEAVKPGMTIFLDAGTTLFSLAMELSLNPVSSVRIVTNNLAIAEILSPVEGVRVELTGGRLMSKQSVLLGKLAQESIRSLEIDVAFLGAVGFDREGIWNNQDEVVDLQKSVIERSDKNVFCMDDKKAGQGKGHFLVNWKFVDVLLTDSRRENLKEWGIPTSRLNMWSV